MDPRTRRVFLALILTQALHSIEEIWFRLYEVFAPARFASELVSGDPATGFALLNAAIIAFGLWCYVARVRPGATSAVAWMWLWVLIELGNGLVHVTVAILRATYVPGLVTAPLLFVLAWILARQLVRRRQAR